MPDGVKIRVSLPSPYSVVDLANLLATTTCKRKKLRPMEMTALVRDDEVIFVDGTAAQPGPEPLGAARTVLDPEGPLPATIAGETLQAERDAQEREAAAAAVLLQDQIACVGSKCTIDTAGVAPLVNDRLLSSHLRLVPNRAIAGGLKLYGVRPTSLLGSVGVPNGSTLLTVDGTPAAEVMDSNTALRAHLELLFPSSSCSGRRLIEANPDSTTMVRSLPRYWDRTERSTARDACGRTR